jgi:hypothetical protein
MILTENPLSLLALLPWAALWLAGGLAFAGAAFRLGPTETWLVGVTSGWLVQNWLANLLSLVLPVPVGFWLASILVFGCGVWAWARAGRLVDWVRAARGALAPLLILLALVWVFFNIARGMAIFDDFQHLPAASLIAAGDFPPHFVLDPDVPFGYHHFLLLFAGQLIRVGGLSPWAAVDAARALSFGLAVMLGALFAQRITCSRLAGMLGGMAVAFGSGARWLLLLAPPQLVRVFGGSVELIGSGLASGPTLGASLTNTWAVEGAGPIGFPFAFANGIYPAGAVLAHTANGLAGFAVTFVLLLTATRWRGWPGAVYTAVIVSIWGLLGEAELPIIAAGWGLVALAWAVGQRSLRLPASLWVWLSAAAAGVITGLLEGGAWTDLIFKILRRLTGIGSVDSYQTVGFDLAVPPVVVSSHLGVLPLFHPATLVVALVEMGPVLLVFPLLAAWGWKAFRLRRWFEAATAASAVFAVLMLFVTFTGSTGVRNTPRLYVFMPLLAAFAVPLVWRWAAHRAQWVKLTAAGLGAVWLFGGLVMGGVSLLAAQRPVYSYFITPLDVRIMRAHWNDLLPGALVFDPTPYRAPTLFGRHTNASYTWYRAKPKWEALYADPNPVAMRKSGFRYVYLDDGYWNGLTDAQRESFACTLVVDEAADNQGRFRRLLDVTPCP